MLVDDHVVMMLEGLWLGRVVSVLGSSLGDRNLDDAAGQARPDDRADGVGRVVPEQAVRRVQHFVGHVFHEAHEDVASATQRDGMQRARRAAGTGTRHFREQSHAFFDAPTSARS